MQRRGLLKTIPALGVAVVFPALALTTAVPNKLSSLDIMNRRRLNIKIAERICWDVGFVTEAYGCNDLNSKEVLRTLVSRYMSELERIRAIVKWKCICDDTNNPVSVIDANRIGIHVWWQYTNDDMSYHYMQS
jgi:hypothetical protein